MAFRRINFLGSRRSAPDPRDYHYSARVAAASSYPDSVDLRPRLPAVWDQGTLGSCEAHAGAALMAFLYPQFIPSRLAIYYWGRAMEGTTTQDVGMETRDLMRVLTSGTFSENAWEYDIAKFAVPPPTEGIGITAKIGAYSRLTSQADMLTCLAGGNPFVFAFDVPDYFEDDFFSIGKLRLPSGGYNSIGRHCVLAVGYDLPSQQILARNSWGDTLGNSPTPGYFWLPVSWIVNPSTGGDAWAAHLDPATSAALP